MLRPGNVSRLFVLFAAMALPAFGPAGCHAPPGSPGAEAAAIGKDVAACALSAAVQSVALDLLPQVLDTLRGGGDDWGAQLDKLRARGADALGCAVEKALAHLTPAPAAPGAPKAEGGSAEDQRAAERARAYREHLRSGKPLPGVPAPFAATGEPCVRPEVGRAIAAGEKVCPPSVPLPQVPAAGASASAGTIGR